MNFEHADARTLRAAADRAAHATFIPDYTPPPDPALQAAEHAAHAAAHAAALLETPADRFPIAAEVHAKLADIHARIAAKLTAVVSN